MVILNGMTSASGALRYWERRQEVTANNLANVSTNGFKAERSFGSLLDGTPVVGTHIDRRVGNIRQTGDSMDIALGNDGFLVVNTPQGERFSRGGHLEVDADGYLADSGEHQLLGRSGPIKVGNAKVTLDAQGNVTVDGNKVDQLRVESAPAGATLAHEGGNLLVPDSVRTLVPIDQRDIRQGAVEESNVDSLGGLVDMISVQRAYAAVEKSITLLDHVRETASSLLGKPAA
ncbi:MAG: flagellar hook-basal body protein [Gemmatimonadetes bacterium]|nr:flagellar hook-basal body protein [Gemmatimonadota bacterium]